MKVLVMPAWMKPYMAKLRRDYPQHRFVEVGSAEVAKEAVDAEVVFGYLSSGQFKTARSLKWIQTAGAGVEGLLGRVPEIAESGVIVTNARGAGAPIIGEHAVAMMLALARQFLRFEQDRRDRRWDQDGALEVVEYLGGKTAGIIGFGKSGRETGWRCKALGMSVIALDRHPVDGDPVVDQVWTDDRLADLLGESDYVVVTVPLTPESRNLIGANELAMMKRTARLIVTSRGGIVDQVALGTALRDGTIAGAALDTVAEEPMPADDPLWEAPNLIITPHIAGNAEPELLDRRTFAIFEENLRRYVKGLPLMNVVNKRLGY